MIAVGLPGAALRALLLRAVLLWISVRLLLSVVGALAAALAGGGGPALSSPLGTILISCALGLVDIRRRHERALWANLGISLVAVGTVFASIATIGETALFFVRSALR